MAPIIIGLAARAGSFAVIDSTVDGVWCLAPARRKNGCMESCLVVSPPFVLDERQKNTDFLEGLALFHG